MQEIIIPIVEDEPNDVLAAQRLLEGRHFWIESCGPAEWLRDLTIRCEWVCGDVVEREGRVPRETALQRVLELDPPVLILDLALSPLDNKIIPNELETLETEKEMVRALDGRAMDVGGFWILRQLHRLWRLGFTVPLVAVCTQFPRIAQPAEYVGAWVSLPWHKVLLAHGATWVVGKTFSEPAALRILNATASILGTRRPGALPGQFSQALDRPGETWGIAEKVLFRRLHRLLEADPESRARTAMAKRLGISYNTYRQWLKESGLESEGLSDG